MRRTYLPPQSKLTIGIACTITRPQVTKMTNQQCKIPARVNYKTKVKGLPVNAYMNSVLGSDQLRN
jgi:hypothetical protein